MDAFEQVVSEILWAEGCWVQTSVKVKLEKEEKRAINRPSSPRWELDVVAYKGSENLLRVIECKSYLDGRGVSADDIIRPKPGKNNRYKLFTDDHLREVVFNRLIQQFVEVGRCADKPEVQLELVCGKIKSDKDRVELSEHFAVKRWELRDEQWLRDGLRGMVEGGYENQVSAVVAKLLPRDVE